jgi:excisionase family DNA binding protein
MGARPVRSQFGGMSKSVYPSTQGAISGGGGNRRGIVRKGLCRPIIEDGARSPSRTPAPAVISGARKLDAPHSLAEGGPIPDDQRPGSGSSDLPAWALERHCIGRLDDLLRSDWTTQERVASGVACLPHSSHFRRLVTVGETATILNVSAKTVRRLIERGELRSVRIGRSIRVRIGDIERLISDRSNA